MRSAAAPRVAEAAREPNRIRREWKHDDGTTVGWQRGCMRCARARTSANEERGQNRPRSQHRTHPTRHGTFDGGAGGGVVDPGFEKSTVGASRFAAFVTSKYGFAFAPMTFAVSAVGNFLMNVLYCWAA